MSALAQGYLISLYDSEGMVVWDAESHDMTLCGQVMAEISRRMEVERPSLAGEFVTHEYELGDPGHSIGRLVVKSYGPYFLTENDFDFLHTLNLILLTIGLLALILAVLAGSWLARRLVRPLAATAHGATAISGGDYRIRLVRKSNIRELDELAQAVNHLAYSLGQQEGLRQRLTTDVAHELRTPLSAIASHLEMMMEGIWEPSPERLQSCYEEIARLSNLVSDLENLASIENGNLALHRAPLDLLALAHSVSANFESECAQKGIALKVEGSPAVVNADKGRLTQVLTNLLSNALKYTPAEGHIHLQVEDTPESGVVVVADDGIGIPQEDLPLVFERFYRTDASRARATGGGGIGLAIARSIVAAHGGTITAESGTAPPIHRGTGADAGTGREQTAAPGDTQAEGKADQEQRTPPTGAVAPGSRFIITLPKGSYPG
jgi:signal transduction histidine kinase